MGERERERERERESIFQQQQQTAEAITGVVELIDDADDLYLQG